jgi:DNA-binding response OmpR family regulator
VTGHPAWGDRSQMGPDANPAVLVVEDDPAIGTMLVSLLSAEGYRADLVADGRQVLPSVRDRQPDLITLDLSLPHLDGNEILDLLDGSAGTGVPVVVVSAYTERLAERHRRRVAAVITKPFEIDDLLSSIETALDQMGDGG